MESALTEEEQAVWESARKYSQERLLPRVEHAYAQESKWATRCFWS